MEENQGTSSEALDDIYKQSSESQGEQVSQPSPQPVQSNDNMPDVADVNNLRQKNPAPRQFAPNAAKPTSVLDDRAKFLDDRALQTYYYLNVSEGKVVLSDLGVAIQAGQPVDLLDIANEEDVLKSKDVRRAIRVHGDVPPFLKRLTSEEFDRLYQRFVEREGNLAQIRADKEAQLDEAQKNPAAFKIMKSSDGNELDIRPQLQSMVEKLRIGTGNVNEQEAKYITRNKVAGMAPEEFLAKVEVMNLKPDEVEYVFQTVMHKQVRDVMIQQYGYKGT